MSNYFIFYYILFFSTFFASAYLMLILNTLKKIAVCFIISIITILIINFSAIEDYKILKKINVTVN